MDPFWTAILIVAGVTLLALGSQIRSRSLHSSERRRAHRLRRESGRVGWILLWLLGVPIPVLLVLYLLRGCT
jgi:hypothetical protein